MAALVERPESAGLERQDFSLEAWQSGVRPEPPALVFGFWKCHYHPEQEAKTPLLGDPELLDLFEDLAGSQDSRQVTFRYVLSLLLIRRRMLRVVGTRQAGGKSVMLVVPKGDASRQPIEVLDPGMDDAAVADAIEQLGSVIDTDARGKA